MTEASAAADQQTSAAEAAEGAAASKVDRSSGRNGWTHAWRLLLLAVVALAVLVPGIASLPLTDRDEALYVQATRQMLESGNWVDIRIQDEPRYKKPVGIYWMQGIAAAATGQGADAPLWAFRVPSLIGALAAVLFTYGIAALFAGPTAGLLAGLLAAGTLTLGLEARLAKTDAMLLATVMAAQYALALAYMAREPVRSLPRNALFWTAIAVGILIKGPITPMIVGLTILVLTVIRRSLALVKALSPLWGLAWTVLLVAPWLVAIGIISHGDFFTKSVGQDMLGKVASAQQSHGAPPGTYLVAAIGTFWPLSLFAPIGLAWGWRRHADPAAQFLWAWLIPGWLVFELVATKLPNYVLPFMPAVAILTALSLAGAGLKAELRSRRLMFSAVALVAVLLGLGLNAAFVLVQGNADLTGLGAGIVCGALGILASRLLIGGRLWPGIGAAVAAAAAAYVTAYAILLPAAEQIWLSDRVAEAVKSNAGCAAPEVIVVGYREPSLLVRLGTRTHLASAEEGAAAFEAASCSVAAVAVENVPAFLAALTRNGEPPIPEAMVEARNLNGMKLRSLQIFVKS